MVIPHARGEATAVPRFADSFGVGNLRDISANIADVSDSDAVQSRETRGGKDL